MKIFTKEWFKAAGIRALRTLAQTAIGAFGSTVMIHEVNWVFVGSTAAFAALLSILMSLAGLPEVPVPNEPEAVTIEEKPPDGEE